MARLTITPAHPVLGARVEGVDLAAPLDDATSGEGPTADPPYATRTPAWDGIVPHGVGV